MKVALLDTDGKYRLSEVRFEKRSSLRTHGIQAILHFFSRLEKWHPSVIDKDGLPVLRVSPGSRRAVPHGENSEPAKLDPLALFQRLDNSLENDVNDPLDVSLVEVGIVRRDYLDEFRSYHFWPVKSGD